MTKQKDMLRMAREEGLPKQEAGFLAGQLGRLTETNRKQAEIILAQTKTHVCTQRWVDHR